ncbi:unnamed protein product, partial [Rotaria sp. Silwood1]
MDDHRLNLVASTTDSIANVVNTSTKEKNEEITLIWFDENTNINTDDVIHIKEILCEKIKIFKNLKTCPLLHYRGLQMPFNDVENMCKSIGNLISTNGFLSTTRDIDVAYMYAGIEIPTNNEKIPTLFIINVNIESQTNILADIGAISMISDESE